mgnify:CR=1 FL=1
MCIILWDGAIIGVYTKEKIINTYPPLFKSAPAQWRAGADFVCAPWARYKVQKLNQLIRGWINYFKIGSMKGLCERLDSNIRYRLWMCIWKHWKTPQNRAKNLMKLDVPRWAAYKIAYCGNRYARLAHNGWVHKAISNERLAAFGLVSMSNYYAERRVICEVD